MSYAITISDPKGYFLGWYTVQGERYPFVTDEPEKIWKSRRVAEKTLNKLPYPHNAEIEEVEEGAGE